MAQLDCARGEALFEPRGVTLDWPAFADAWRGEYQGAMDEVRSGRIAFCKLDVLHRRNLEITLTRFGVTGLSEDDKRDLNLAWHRLDAWPDVPQGLARLKRQYLLAPVSNGNISLMVDLARRNDLPWDAILGAEIAGDYKPKPQVYLASAAAFDLVPDVCMMVAAHSKDLAAAAAFGLAHRACGAAERARPRPRRSRADRPGRFCGAKSRRAGGQARRVVHRRWLHRASVSG